MRIFACVSTALMLLSFTATEASILDDIAALTRRQADTETLMQKQSLEMREISKDLAAVRDENAKLRDWLLFMRGLMDAATREPPTSSDLDFTDLGSAGSFMSAGSAGSAANAGGAAAAWSRETGASDVDPNTDSGSGFDYDEHQRRKLTDSSSSYGEISFSNGHFEANCKSPN